MKESWIWVPNKSLGEIFLESKIDDYIESHDLALIKESYSTYQWMNYKPRGYDISIFFDENRLVTGITSMDYFFYKGENFIGLMGVDLISLLKEKPEIGQSIEFDDGDVHDAWSFDSLGLDVHLSNDGVIVLASCIDLSGS